MKALDIILLFVLFILFFISMYLLWLNLPSQPTEFQTYSINITNNLSNTSQQFLKNMRYPDSKISYFISPNCTNKRANDFRRAVAKLEQLTILKFYENSTKPEIIVSCSNIPEENNEEGHFIAGEGGPSQIINGTQFSIILSGKIALYRHDKCEEPQIAMHELLHALGFDHNNNPESIMFPVTNCNQKIDEKIIQEINNLYTIPSRPELVIEKASANKTGNYLNIEVIMANYGLVRAEKFVLKIKADNEVSKLFNIEDLEINSKRYLIATNIKIPRSAQNVTIEIISSQPELSKNNNAVTIKTLPNE